MQEDGGQWRGMRMEDNGGGWSSRLSCPLGRKAGRRGLEDVYDHTQSKVPIPVPLMAVKRLMVWLVLGRVTTREYQML